MSNEIFLFENGIEVSIKEDSSIFVTNKTGLVYRISFYNPNKLYHGHVHFNFKPGFWVSSTPKKWPINQTDDIVEVVLTGPDHQFKFIIDQKNKKILFESDNFIEVNDYKVIDKSISFVLAAHKTHDYINEVIEKILTLRRKHLNLEILIGVDACEETFKVISKSYYPPEVKIYFFEENVGLFIVRNTLVEKAKYNDIIIMDSDDLPKENILSIYFQNYKENDFISWGNFCFLDGTDYKDSNNLTYSQGPWGCFGLKKDKFLKVNGFQPWRCNGDDEFTKRFLHYGYSIKFIDEAGYYYRVRDNSLSRDKTTKKGSIIRSSYVKIMEENTNNNSWPNPDRLYTEKCIRIR